MSALTIYQLEQISGMVTEIIAKAPPKRLETRRLVLRLATLDQVVARKKEYEGGMV